MTNSDIISALSLALTAIIFLLQTDDGLLKLKIRSNEKWVIMSALIVIILLANSQIFERFGATFYFSVGHFYLLPNEWALIIFLILIWIILRRIFTQRIFNNNPDAIFALINKYRAENKVSKLHPLLLQIMELKDFESNYAGKLDDTIFNDHYLVEYFSANCPEVLIEFTKKHKQASINRGDHFYYILNGLFSDKSNKVFSEIRLYKEESDKSIFLDGWDFYISDFKYDSTKNYKTNLEIIGWLTNILASFPHDLKRETIYFLNHFKDQASLNNDNIFSENEIKTAFSRDNLYSSIQLFRILLIELSFTNKRTQPLIGRVLAMLYSSWDFVENHTELKSDKVHLGNDSYTFNEYLLKYIFDSYCSLYILSNKVLFELNESDNEEKNYTGFILGQLARKLNSLVASNRIPDKSKEYYITALIELYFDFPDYFVGLVLDKCSKALLYELKDSLAKSLFGNPTEYQMHFINACKKHEFYRKNNSENMHRAELFYSELLPYSDGLKNHICDI
jgi:hypothetical protein